MQIRFILLDPAVEEVMISSREESSSTLSWSSAHQSLQARTKGHGVLTPWSWDPSRCQEDPVFLAQCPRMHLSRGHPAEVALSRVTSYSLSGYCVKQRCYIPGVALQTPCVTSAEDVY